MHFPYAPKFRFEPVIRPVPILLMAYLLTLAVLHMYWMCTLRLTEGALRDLLEGPFLLRLTLFQLLTLCNVVWLLLLVADWRGSRSSGPWQRRGYRAASVIGFAQLALLQYALLGHRSALWSLLEP